MYASAVPWRPRSRSDGSGHGVAGGEGLDELDGVAVGVAEEGDAKGGGCRGEVFGRNVEGDAVGGELGVRVVDALDLEGEVVPAAAGRHRRRIFDELDGRVARGKEDDPEPGEG